MNDLRFNRKRIKGKRVYLNEYLERNRKAGDQLYQGMIKCKLGHSQGYSLIIPDQVYIKFGNILRWVQPLFFSGNNIFLDDDLCFCTIVIDISHGLVLTVQFKNSSMIKHMKDGSILYTCDIYSRKNLYQYTTGKAKLIEGEPVIILFHHTSSQAEKSIKSCGYFRTSDWNIQGNKKCNNYSFLYLTALPKVSQKSDLQQIAMSHNGVSALRLDQNNSENPDVLIKVYRESTSNREKTLQVWIKSSDLAPQPCWRHEQKTMPGYHEIVLPFVHRIPAKPKSKVSFGNPTLNPDHFKKIDRLIVGNANTKTGLYAPYDEEHSDEFLSIQQVDSPHEFLSFWMKNSNMQMYNPITQKAPMF